MFGWVTKGEGSWRCCGKGTTIRTCHIKIHFQLTKRDGLKKAIEESMLSQIALFWQLDMEF